MARPLHVVALGASFLNKQTTSAYAILSRLAFPAHSDSCPVRLCSSQNIYKIDHSGFVNPLEPNPPRNDQLGVRDKIVNRNPRVLEHMNIARRQNGWTFQAPKRDYINKLVIETKGRFVLAYVEHYSGEKVVWASSQEHSLMKRLYSLTDLSAVKAVAQVLARRCLKAGLHHVAVVEPPQVLQTSQRLAAFVDILTSHGISLEEPKQVYPPHRLGVDYDVVDPTLYVDDEAKAVKWPQSDEDYDPEKDELWHVENIARKHHGYPEKSWEELRPLIDPEPKVYPKAGSHKQMDSELDSRKKIAEISDVKLLD